MARNITEIEDFEIVKGGGSVLICFYYDKLIKNESPCKFDGDNFLIELEPDVYLTLNAIRSGDKEAIEKAEHIVVNTTTDADKHTQVFVKYQK